MLEHRSLQTRVIVPLVIIAALGIALLVCFVTVRTQQLLHAEALDKARETALNDGQLVAANLNDALAAARTLAKVCEAGAAHRDKIDRPMFLDMLKKTVEAQAHYYGAWVQFKPNWFDGRDAEFVNKDGYMEDGGFLPYATRSDKEVTVAPSNGTYDKYKDESYYKIPLEGKIETIIEPYVDPDKHLLMSSLAVPVFENGETFGVAGIDMVLTTISETVSKIKPFGTGQAFLISNGGVIVGHPRAELAGKPLAEHGASPELLAAIQQGKELQQVVNSPETGEMMLVQYVPVPIGNGHTPWSFGVSVPLDTVLAGARGMMRISLTIALFALAVLMAAIFLVTRAIVRPLNEVIAVLGESASHLDSSAYQVAEAGDKLAKGAVSQAASLEQTSAALEEMTSVTNQNAANANEADAVMKDTVFVVDQGHSAVNAMSEAIDKMRASAQETAQVLKVIDSIAFQTNLLALNAAVEAARAGDAGKGFAVVAQEVRSLAQRSAEASKNSAELLEELRRNSENGVTTAERVKQSFDRIRESAGNIARLIQGIAVASKEQAAGIGQINTAVTQIEQITQSNTAYSEESASAGQELLQQATELTGVLHSLEILVAGHAETVARSVDRRARTDAGRLAALPEASSRAQLEHLG